MNVNFYGVALLFDARFLILKGIKLLMPQAKQPVSSATICALCVSPLMVKQFVIDLRMLAIPSIVSALIRGDTGQPCFVLQEELLDVVCC